MKTEILIFLAWAAFLVPVSAQEKGSTADLVFTDEILLPATPVQNQSRTSTCWAFSALSFFESEMLRKGKPAANLSEMFVVYHTYLKKAEKFIRMQGNTTFAPGGAFHDVAWAFREYGLLPEEVYGGLNYGETNHAHGEMDQLLRGQVEALVKNPNRKLSPVWQEPVKAALEAYLGKVPDQFAYEGKIYTPQAFARDVTGLDMDDYVEVTSFMHHPYYGSFILEVPDNWSWDAVYNIPLEEMGDIVDYSLRRGYTVAWASDTSDPGFQSRGKGIAWVPAEGPNGGQPDDTGREAEITPEMRQAAFDNLTTTDDHGMHIIGIAKDQNGKTWYKVKNSWGIQGPHEGYLYVSRAYLLYKTTCLMVHKEGIPHPVAKKLDL